MGKGGTDREREEEKERGVKEAREGEREESKGIGDGILLPHRGVVVVVVINKK